MAGFTVSIFNVVLP